MSLAVPVHGGLVNPVHRVIPLSYRKQLLIQQKNLASIQVSKSDESLIQRFSDGTLSPLSGPMDKTTWHQVLEDEFISYHFKKYAWTIPLSLPVTEAEAEGLKPGQLAVLITEKGEPFGLLESTGVFSWDKKKFIRSVYGTDREDHPGADLILKDPRHHLVGGPIWALPPEHPTSYARFMTSPRQTRLHLQERQWERAIAFQTRNPLHRAHEYALVAAVERLTASGAFTGVVLHPLTGELKNDDVPATTRMKCYQTLLEKGLLGEGDKNRQLWTETGYDITEVFTLMGLDMKMFYAGPKEAVMHAIYRQNHGFSDIVIGRKHADAPFHDGTAIWGDFDAQTIFQQLKGELAIQPCPIGFAAYYESQGRVDLMENHPDEKPLFISGSAIRQTLTSGQIPDERVLRPQISELLIEYYQS